MYLELQELHELWKLAAGCAGAQESGAATVLPPFATAAVSGAASQNMNLPQSLRSMRHRVDVSIIRGVIGVRAFGHACSVAAFGCFREVHGD